ncbi:MAG TPA: APC family permease [Nocardioides sp.]|jgi:amino acid transporter|uniref:APC family permease n=1 Tax=Nocardioides sp. TaxID=35761 RepID=UPI002E320AB8|nr:APC family permease [Nocardioides sp.]HEX3931319.1 APC family permease [Nocardioides sp.]
MTSQEMTGSEFVEVPVDAGHKLKTGAIGMVAVLFMATANAAPITAMSANTPIAVGYGNGLAAPGGFLFATIVLTLFAVGFVSMARHVTTTGAFYGFISQGLGQVWGMAAGLVATLAYVVFEGSLIGVFAYFTQSTLDSWFSVKPNWFLIAVVGIVLIALFGHYDINIAAAFLGVCLVCEVLLLAAMAFTVLFKGGGHDGLMGSSINPVNAFKSMSSGGNLPGSSASLGVSGVAAGSAAIGVFFAFWSWVGFETTAVYGEESRDPKRIVPRATMIAVVGLGLFYTFVSWMAVSGTGAKQSIATSAGSNPVDLMKGTFDQYLGHPSTYVFDFLIVTGSFACALAFHNAASRYIYAIGREIPSTQNTLGATHAHHGSPHIASAIQSGITLVITILFWLKMGNDVVQAAYVYEYGLLAVLGTMAILLVQALCSVAVIWYFQVKRVHPGNIVTTGVIPALGAIGMLYVCYLLFSNLSFAGGAASGSLLYKLIPYIVGATFLIGLAFMLWLRARDPEQYQRIGRTVLEDAHERA